MSRKVHVALEYETWKKLAVMKLEHGKRTFNDVINMLLENFEGVKSGEKRVPRKD